LKYILLLLNIKRVLKYKRKTLPKFRNRLF
jgi:hypothetical protein